jgi:hypothetical protein
MSRRVELLVGAMLLLIGVLVLAAEPLADAARALGIDDRVWAYWPVLLLLLSLVFLVPAFVGGPPRRVRAGMVIPGMVLAVGGGVLLYSSLADRWADWSYLWTFMPFGVGLGLYAAGWIADAPALKWIGSFIAAGATIAFLVFASAFGGEAFRLVGALAIIAVGLALVAGGLAERLSRKSPA